MAAGVSGWRAALLQDGGTSPLLPALRYMGRIQWEWKQNKFRDSRAGHIPYFFILAFIFRFKEYMGKVQK